MRSPQGRETEAQTERGISPSHTSVASVSPYQEIAHDEPWLSTGMESPSRGFGDAAVLHGRGGGGGWGAGVGVMQFRVPLSILNALLSAQPQIVPFPCEPPVWMQPALCLLPRQRTCVLVAGDRRTPRMDGQGCSGASLR